MDRKTRVIHIISGLTTGGAETMLCRLLEHSDHRSFSHRVISLRGRGALAERIEKHSPLRALNLKGPRLPLDFFRLTREIRQFEPDLVQTWLTHGTVFGSAATLLSPKTRLLWSIHTGMADRSRLKLSTRLLTRAMAATADFLPDRIVSCSEFAARRHEEMGFPPSRMTIIPNGTPTERFRRRYEAGAQFRLELGVPEDADVVGIAGRWTSEKDFPNFFRSALRVQKSRPDTYFLLCGPGVVRGNEAAERYIRRSSRPDRFLLLGLRPDMPAFYAACTTVTLSSRSEAFPLVLGEAMAAGVPCVSTDVGDARRIIGDTGFVVPPEDPDALAEGLERMLRLDAVTYRDLGNRAARRIHERFSVQRCVEDYQQLFREMVHGAPSADSQPGEEPAAAALDLTPARAGSRRGRLRRAMRNRAKARDASA